MNALSPSDALGATPDPAWTIEQHGFDALRDSSRESRFAISNGVLGVRGGRAVNRRQECGEHPHTLVAGLFDTAGSDQPIPGLVQAPGWLRVRLSLPGAMPALHVDDKHIHQRTLDLKRGALLTRGRLASPTGLAVALRMLRLVSMHDRALGLQVMRVEIEAGAGDLTLEASFDGLEFGLAIDRRNRRALIGRHGADARAGIALQPALALERRGRPGAVVRAHDRRRPRKGR